MFHKLLEGYDVRWGKTPVLLLRLSTSLVSVWPWMYLLPLSAEKKAAKKHMIAPTMNASLSAAMKGDEIALGKKVDPVRS